MLNAIVTRGVVNTDCTIVGFASAVSNDNMSGDSTREDGPFQELCVQETAFADEVESLRGQVSRWFYWNS